MSSKTVVIQLLSGWMDVAVVRGPRVVASRRINVDLPPDSDDWMQAVRSLGRSVRSELASMNVVNGRAYVVYRSPSQAIDVALLPVTSRADAYEGALLAFVDSLGYAEELATMEAVVLGCDTGSGGKTHVLVGGDRDDAVQAIADMVEAAGLRFMSATPLDAAVAHWLLRRAQRSNERLHAWLYVGQMNSFLLAAGNGRVQFGRNIRLGVETLITSLTRPIRLHGNDEPVLLDAARARKIVYGHGVPERDDSVCTDPPLTGGQVLPMLQPVLQRYIIELRQSLRFGLSDQERAAVALTITGPGASLPGLVELLGAELDMTVERDETRASFDPYTPAHPEGELADVLHHRSFFNQMALVPKATGESRAATRMKRWLVTGAVAAVALIGFDAFRYQTHLDSAAERLDQFERQTSQHEKLDETRDRLLNAIGSMRELEARIARETEAQLDVRAAMRELSRLTPATVKLTSVSMQRDRGRVVGRLTGYALEGEEAGQEEIDSFIRRLDDSPLFDDLMLGKVEKATHRGREGSRFNATFIAVEPPSLALVQEGDGS